MKTIGFLINPIAGLGGSVGLKGTDGLADEALRLGANPKAGKRAKEALENLRDVFFLTCKGEMGEDTLKSLDIKHEVVYYPGEKTSAEDTRGACRAFLERNADLIVFCGGDGTARDVYSIVGDRIPILGIPAGVKMHSAVFSIKPAAAAEIIERYLMGDLPLKEAEVMDIDEEAYRNNRPQAKLYGYAKTPYLPEKVQGRKFSFHEVEDEESKREIARFALEFMRDGSLYIIGAGSTTKAIKDALGIHGTLLGVDLVRDGRLMVKDAGEKEILGALGEGKAKIIVTPIGAQGFLFGRGNQQISPGVLDRVGLENIIVVATPHKLANTPRLRVDTGDAESDKKLTGSRQIVCGYRMAQRRTVD